MIQFLEFTFSSFWHFIGVYILLALVWQLILNIAILIAYLKLIRTKRHINILFLDEVFASIDSDGIESILFLLT